MAEHVIETEKYIIRLLSEHSVPCQAYSHSALEVFSARDGNNAFIDIDLFILWLKNLKKRIFNCLIFNYL